MKRISYWAKTHKWPARIIIIVSFIVLNILGIVTGILLSQLNVNVPIIAMLVFLVTFFIGWVVYPSKDEKWKKLSPSAFYIKQKICDFALVSSTFCMVVYLGNHPDRLFQLYPSLNAATKTELPTPKDSLVKGYKSIKDFSASMKNANGNDLKWKEKKKLLKEQIREIKKSKESSNAEKTMLVILSILVALGLQVLVLSLACNLSCSGSDAAAVLVGIGGTALIILLLVIVIRSIYGKKKKQKQTAEKPAQGN